MSDEEYQKFLDKASGDINSNLVHETKSSSDIRDSNLAQKKPLPQGLQSLIDQERVYSTESDEPFRAISLAYQGPTNYVSEKSFKGLFGQDGAEVAMKNFDARGEYFDVIECVAEAAQRKPEDVQIFKTQSGQVRSEYWIITITDDKQCIIGLVATAIES